MAEKKKIAILQTALTIGGIEKTLVSLLDVVDYEKVDIDLYLLERKGEFLSEISNKVNVKGLKGFSGSKRKALKYFCAFKFKKAFFELKKYKMLYPKVRKNNYYEQYLKLLPRNEFCSYDKVIVYNSNSVLSSMIAIYQINAKEKYIWVHNDLGNSYDANLFNKFDKIICVSKGIESLFLSYYPICKGKTDIAYNILDEKELKDKSLEIIDDFDYTKISLVSVGRFAREKGFQFVPDIVNKLVKEGFDFNWYLLGDGPLFNSVQERIKKEKIASLKLLGLKTNPYPYMKNCTIYVQPSLSEGLCTTTNEAKYLCKPIIVTNVSGMKEQFTHDKDAYIVDDISVDAIYNGIKFMLSNKEYREKLVSNLQINENFNKDRVEKLKRIIEE
ncbi:MAG: glycosyltransferase [Clostridia bacterium]|nr:glycosyltransferase [Clostridia bacterium]